MHYKASVWHLTDCVITAQGEKRRATERTRAVPVPSPRPVRPRPPLSLSLCVLKGSLRTRVIAPIQIKCVFLLRSLHRPGRARAWCTVSTVSVCVYVCVCERE